MNKRQMVFAVLMIGAVSTFSYAQSFFAADQNISSEKKETLDKRLAYSLRLDNDGVVESALALVAMMKMDLPADEFPKIQKEIHRLSMHGQTAVIRYKAYLAETVFTNPEMFNAEHAATYENADAFFHALAQRISATFLSIR